MKLTFVHFVDIQMAQTQMFGVHYMPVWIYTLASYLRPIENLEITMFDNRVMDIAEFPKSDIYLFTGINQEYRALTLFLKESRLEQPTAVFILGGPICWSYQQAGKIQDLFAFDHLIIGDGEGVVRSLVESLMNKKPIEKVLTWSKKFEVKESVLMDRTLMDQTLQSYYGAVIEVSRGCPFLCEFCDIRIQKDNNQPHNVLPEKIVQEIDYFVRKGIKQILFACDNFIGDPIWAESVCDHIILWKQQTGLSVNIYTWLTINLSNYSTLMNKLRLAGFDMFFIGIESFENNQLLETAKIQNVKSSLVESIQKIQSNGFIIVAGLIFGFDTEPDYVCDSTLDGILKSGLISGEPSLLTALPGTPLYKRMKYSNRLRDGKLGLGGFKYQTNIKYLKPKQQIIDNFFLFVEKYTKGKYQYSRYKTFCSLLKDDSPSTNQASGYIDVPTLFKIAFKNKSTLILLMRRFLRLLSNPERLFYFSKALLLTVGFQVRGQSRWKYFNFWFFVWSNSVIKFSSLTPGQFDIGSVDADFSLDKLIPTEYTEELTEPIPEHKIRAQRKYTTEALTKYAALKSAKN